MSINPENKDVHLKNMDSTPVNPPSTEESVEKKTYTGHRWNKLKKAAQDLISDFLKKKETSLPEESHPPVEHHAHLLQPEEKVSHIVEERFHPHPPPETKISRSTRETLNDLDGEVERMTLAEDISEEKTPFFAKIKQRILKTELVDLPTLDETKSSFKSKLQSLKAFADRVATSSNEGAKQQFIKLYDKLKKTAFYHFMAANSQRLASKLEKTVDGMRGNKVDFDDTNYMALPVIDPEIHYAPIAAQSKEHEFLNIQSPVPARSARDPIQLPDTKARLGSGVSKEVFGLRRRGGITKQLLKQIKLKPKILTPSQFQALLPGIRSIAVSNPEAETQVNALIKKIEDYPHMTLEDQVKFTKSFNRWLNKVALFPPKDIATILSRHHEDFEKSLGHKLKKISEDPSGHSGEEIEKLTLLKNLYEQNQGNRETIAENYHQLSDEQKLSISQFLSAYLKEKRARAVVGEQKSNVEEETFKREEIEPVIRLNSSLKALDEEIQSAKEQNDSGRLEELSKLREWSDHIATVEVAAEGSKSLLVAKKFKFGNLKGIIENDKEYIHSEEMLNGMISVGQGLAAMHARDFIHRDIALRNILVTDQTDFKTNPDSQQLERKYDLRFAISDFGRMKQLEGQETARLEGNMHPITWMAPEELRNGKSSKKSDVFSYGATLVESLMGTANFVNYCRRGNSGEEISQCVLWEIENNQSFIRKQFEQYCEDKHLTLDDKVKDIIFACLEVNPENRPTLSEAVTRLQNLEDRSSFKLA